MSNYVHNDLKPDNIMVNRKTGEVTLIDFGMASQYQNPDGTHISASVQTDDFQGNMLYASLDQMNFYKTSRKDDMISVFYILVGLLNNDQLVGKPKDLEKLYQAKADIVHQFDAYRSFREKYSIKYIAAYAKKLQLLNP